MKLRKRMLVSLMAIAVLLLTFGVSSAQGTTVNVTLTASEFKFDPNELNVTAGTEVTFNISNTGQFPHNVTFVAPDGTATKLFAENVAAGQSATGKFTFITAGDWQMYCPVGQHKEQGMVGTVHVAAAAAGAQAPSTASQAGASPSSLPTTGAGDPVVWALAAALIFFVVGFSLRRLGSVRA